jgi:hypothetical protein
MHTYAMMLNYSSIPDPLAHFVPNEAPSARKLIYQPARCGGKLDTSPNRAQNPLVLVRSDGTVRDRAKKHQLSQNGV